MYYVVKKGVARIEYRYRAYAEVGDILYLQQAQGDWGMFQNLSAREKNEKLVGCKFARLRQITEEEARKLLNGEHA
jgi:hypothetical protein